MPVAKVTECGCVWRVDYSMLYGVPVPRFVQLVLVDGRVPVVEDEPARMEGEFMRRLRHPADGLLDRVQDAIVNGAVR